MAAKGEPVELILAANVKALMKANEALRTQDAVAIAATKAGFPIDQKTVGRVLKAAVSVQIDTVQAIAAAFDVQPYQLLVPGLNPRNPQVLRALSPEEENLYRALELARRGPLPGTQ
jgi:hypothetical protein